MKFLHTADWQIGMRAAQVGEAGERVRQERLTALGRVIETARAHAVDFILVAGDTFEDNGVDRTLVQKTADLLSQSPVPAYLIPGNHDPLVPVSVWEHPAWRSAEYLHILDKEEPVAIPGGMLYPCPVREKHSGKDPTRWIEATDWSGISIGLAHGTVEGIHQEEPEYPIPRDAPARAGLDYLALGHWHSTALYPAPDGPVRLAYAGTHEQTKFGERDSGNVLIVEIAAPGTTPQITSVHTGGLHWEVIEARIRESGDLADLRGQIESLAAPANTLLSLRIEGILPADDFAELERIRQIAASRLLHFDMDVSRLRPSPDDDSWLAGLPAGVIRQAGERLQELADPAFSGERPNGGSPEVAARALLELYVRITETQPCA